MDEMKDKMKGFMKKMNNQITSSSSGKFKGQGRVLGSSSSGPTNSILTPNNPRQIPNPSPSLSSANPKPLPKKPPSSSDQNKSSLASNLDPIRQPPNGFDPYDSLITSGKKNPNGYSLNSMYECPICSMAYLSEEEVSIHVETCVNSNSVENDCGDDNEVLASGKLEACVGAFVSAKPPEGSLEVVLRLLRNIVRDPENVKFRKLRMSNQKIREAVSEVAGGVELLEFVGFELREEGGEMWATMEVPAQERISLMNKVILLLEPRKFEQMQKIENVASAEADESVRTEPKKIDRQIRVFFSVPESIAAKIQLPDSFYNLSLAELEREDGMKKKKMAESQLLIPKSYREKQAKAARKKYSRTVIRVQFPDGMVLQAVFAPWETTTTLYELVSSALKEPGLQFELLHPVVVKRRVIPHFPAAGERAMTLDEEDLVPSALIKFRPVETDSVVFTGLCNELLEISEPLVLDSAVGPL
ncbi:UBX domain-containing protein/PUB domain-containing protein [Cephalotus follicularis]|uniref:UBX domain-containing protein/PUB domain-containing protein n=1 Tax=Cephalotus follicularis TaxID=3775 RepID=A0A1Q3BFJ7_CEPFO|nr:UBX domain-containing protein/PUB domain-containing protein [Cephalotus follicularis]